MKKSSQFYNDLPACSNFSDLLNGDVYHEIPEDWWVVITDVVGSTKAIEEGRYKDVNTVGAATLAALRNVMQDITVPFVFGGDGASAVIPHEYIDAAGKELSGLRRLSASEFKLELRVGMVSVKELNQLGHSLLVAKYTLNGDATQAIFRGGGLSMVDAMVKKYQDKYEISDNDEIETDLRQLSCRWKSIKSTNGDIIAILFLDPLDRDDVYQIFVSQLNLILVGGFQLANPVQESAMTYRSLKEMISADLKHQSSLLKRVPRLIDTLFAHLLFGWGLYSLFPFLKKYVKATASHSDFCKFDDMLRMILDCNAQQSKAITLLCDDLRKRFGICYGIHISNEALMTCYVPGFGDGEHIHFIDGGGGGYAIAAKQLKSQMNLKLQENPKI